MEKLELRIHEREHMLIVSGTRMIAEEIQKRRSNGQKWYKLMLSSVHANVTSSTSPYSISVWVASVGISPEIPIVPPIFNEHINKRASSPARSPWPAGKCSYPLTRSTADNFRGGTFDKYTLRVWLLTQCDSWVITGHSDKSSWWWLWLCWQAFLSSWSEPAISDPFAIISSPLHHEHWPGSLPVIRSTRCEKLVFQLDIASGKYC